MTYQQETTLMTVASRLAIGDLTARYNRALEVGDLESWIGTFVQEGVLVRPDGERVSGHRALAGHLRSVAGGRIHLTTDAQVEVDGVQARQDCRFLTLRPGSDGSGPVVEGVGRYRDTLVHERGRWYFAERTMIADAAPAT